MANGVIDSLLDIEKLSTEIKTLETQLNGLVSRIGASLQDVTRIFKDELKKVGDMDFKGLSDALNSLNKGMHGVVDMGVRQQQMNKQLTDSQNKLAASSMEVKKIVDAQIGTIGQNIAAQERHIKMIGQLKTEQNDLKNAFKAGMVSQMEYTSTTEALKIQLAEAEAALSETNIMLRQQAKEGIAAEGSITQLGNSLGQMKKAYRDMSETERESPIGQALLEDIQRLDKAVKAADASIGNHQRNVGNYSSALLGSYQSKLNELQTTLAGTQKGMDELSKTMGVNTKEYQDLQKTVADTTAQINAIKDSMLGAAKDSNSMYVKIRELRGEMRNLQEAMKNGTATEEMKKRFQEVAKEASDVQNTIDRVNGRIRLMASNTAGIQTVVSSLQLVNAGFQVVQGSLVELGIEGEELEKVMDKLNASYNVANGLLTISNALKQKSVLMTSLEAATTSKSVVVKKLAIVTQKALNAAQANMPLLALIAGIALLVGWLGKYALSASKLTKEQKLVNDIQEKSVELYAEKAVKIEVLYTRMTKANLSIEEQQQSLAELNKELENTGVQFKDFQEAQEWIIDNKDKYIQALAEQAMAQAAINEYTEAYKKKQADQKKSSGEFLGFWEKAGIAAKNLYVDIYTLKNPFNIVEEWTEEAKKNQEEALSGYEDTMRIALQEMETHMKAYNDMMKGLGMSGDSDAETQKQIQKLKETLDAYGETEKQKAQKAYVERLNLINANIKDEEERAKYAGKLYQEYQDTITAIHQKAAAEQRKITETITQLRINVLSEGKEKELAVLQAAEAKELAAVVGSATQRAEQVALIEEIYRKKRLKAEQDHEIALNDAQIAASELRLESIQQGSEEEYNERMRILTLQRDSEILLATETGASIEDIRAKYREKEMQAMTDLVESHIKKAEEAAAARLRIAEETLMQEEAALLEQYKNGEINQEQYNEKIAALRHQHTVAAAQDEIDALQKVLDAEALTEDQRKAIADKLYAAKKTLSDTETEQELANIDKVTAARKAATEKAKELAKEAFDMAMDFLQQQSEAKIAEFDAELERIQEWKDRELERLDESVMSDETRAAKTKEINEKAEADRKKIEEEKRKEEQKQAVYQKTSAIMSAIIATAQSIVQTGANLGYPLAIPFQVAAGVIGAAQVALIASQPLPKYAKGVYDDQSHPGGLAIVGDARKHEYGLLPSGRLFETPDTPTLIDIPKGTQVFPDYLTLIKHMNPVPSFSSHEPVEYHFKEMEQNIVRAIENSRTIQTVNIDENGIIVLTDRNKGKTNYINRNIQLTK
jgi:hypothetical protein